MLKRFLSFITENNLIYPHSKPLLAVSGGVDSVVMTDLFHRAGFEFALAHANFQLRGEESERDETFVRKLAEKYHVKLFVKKFETVTCARRKKISIQVAARELRYMWFDELLLKNGFDCVATAHHLDDQVETFLINLARGTGIAGLHGIPLCQGMVIRPMLFAWRNEIEAYALANQLDYVEDSSNKSIKYTRNRIRHKVIPQLEMINPGFRKAVTETIARISAAEEIYNKTIGETGDAIFSWKGDSISIKTDDFFSLYPLETFAWELLSPFGFTKSQIGDIIGLRDSIPGKEITSSTHRLVKDRELLIIVPRRDIDHDPEYVINWSDLQSGMKEPFSLSFEVAHQIPSNLKYPANVALLDLNRLEFPLRLRKWKKGDRFIPFGMTEPKKLSDFFIDLKYSVPEKENQWLLCSAGEIAWVIGKRIDDRFKITKDTKMTLRICVHSS